MIPFGNLSTTLGAPFTGGFAGLASETRGEMLRRGKAKGNGKVRYARRRYGQEKAYRVSAKAHKAHVCSAIGAVVVLEKLAYEGIFGETPRRRFIFRGLVRVF